MKNEFQLKNFLRKGEKELSLICGGYSSIAIEEAIVEFVDKLEIKKRIDRNGVILSLRKKRAAGKGVSVFGDFCNFLLLAEIKERRAGF